MDKALFIADCRKIGKRDFKSILKSLGVKENDVLFVHSDVSVFGKLVTFDRSFILDSFVEILQETVPNGTLILPTFTYSFCKGEKFDIKNSKSTVGALTEHFRRKEGVLRTRHPIFSVAIWGNINDFLDIGKDSFDKKSIFGKLHEKNAKILFLGAPFQSCTYMHYIEQMYGVPYRYMKTFKGKIVDEDGVEYEDEYTYFVRYLDSNVDFNMEKTKEYLLGNKFMKKKQVGFGEILLIESKVLYEEGFKLLDKDIFYFLNTKPDMKKIEEQKIYIQNLETGMQMYELLKQLFPICRSITGNGVRETLKVIQEHIPIKIHEVPTGTKVFDWTVPKEWNIKDAYVMDEKGNKIIDFKNNNLHVVGYSIPVNKIVSLSELQEHLYSLPEQPEAIPYVTSYYKERWGFCIAHKDREKLKEGKYKVFIDSELKEGSLTYGELIIPGKSKKEIFLSTYICHPSMANNELSGPVVVTFLVKWILSKPREYTYRIIFIPETIGSITYLSKNLDEMKKNIVAGFNVSCVGDNRVYSYLPSRYGDTYADKIALNILSFKHPNFIKYSFLDRGGDERQYNAPGVDLPLCCITRSKYGTYPEYHTSLDNLNFVSPEGLYGSYEVIKECLILVEKNRKYKIKCLGEPQLGKRGLYPTISTKSSTKEVKTMMDFICYADGKNDLIDISNKIGVPVWELYPIIEKLLKADLLEIES